MLSHIKFITFKNYLNNNDIFLFDSQYRIAHFRYNQYINNMIQKGGTNLIQSNNILNKINNKKSSLLYHFINSLITNNFIKTNYIVSKYLSTL
jgi:hypothetical protein